MIAADYIAKYLGECGVHDVFGIPGGVILPLVYSFENQKPSLTPHLNYHEQMAGFAACGYAQAANRLGVAYATRGPGITNMVTCMAEAWQESLPVLFITAHGNRGDKCSMRFEFDQEIDLAQSVNSFTKFAANIDNVDDIPRLLQKACQIAMHGRKGPVFLDFSTKILKEELSLCNKNVHFTTMLEGCYENQVAIQIIKDELSRRCRPVILIGDGVRQANCISEVRKWLNLLRIPVLSSRASQDIVCDLEHYYGYIGSHGLRYSNFILSKADLIIAVGNRLSFPVSSKSYTTIVKKSRVIRLEIDSTEFQREFPNVINLFVDIKTFTSESIKHTYNIINPGSWIDICRKLKEELNQSDLTEPVLRIANFLKKVSSIVTYVCDVGNNEFWFSRAFELVRPECHVLYSKSFGTLGSAIGRAIGAYYATKQKVICVIGDQGFQYNIQELQYISYWELPIIILLLNNRASGMICNHENKNYARPLHVTIESGYAVPDFQKLCESYGIHYVNDFTINKPENDFIVLWDKPLVYEISYETIQLEPTLPIGNPCQKMEPLLEKELYQKLNNL